MPIFIPDLFTGYINGRRAAIKDNWKDAENYNSVMKGQLDNALTMQTMADTARKSNASANVADMNQTIAGARTDNELDLLNKQRANNMNDLTAQLQALQARFNIDLMNTDAYKSYMLGMRNNQTTAPTSTPTSTGTPAATGTVAPSTTGTVTPAVPNNLVPGSTAIQLTPEQSNRITALNLPQDKLNQLNTYLGGLGSTAAVDAAIANMERTVLEQRRQNDFLSLSPEQQQALLSGQNSGN